jgi:hypothetical protein
MPAKGWVISLSPQGGREYYPAGSVYSPLAGGMVTTAEPATYDFAAWTFSASFSFE